MNTFKKINSTRFYVYDKYVIVYIKLCTFTLMNERRETFDVESLIKTKLYVNGPYFHLILSPIYMFASNYMYSVLVVAIYTGSTILLL